MQTPNLNEANLTSVMTKDSLAALRERNSERARAAIKALGTKYTCHPTNQIQRKAPEPDRAGLDSAKTMLQRYAQKV